MSLHMCAGLLTLSALTLSQSTIIDSKLIAYAKNLDVSRLDPTLPKQTLEKWLAAQGIADDKLVWERSDCDLMPNFDKPEEPRPLCVRLLVSVRQDAGVITMILVGTEQKGIDGPPKVRTMYTIKGPPTGLQFDNAERLSELPRLIKRARSPSK
jgi:hypothetical protein